MERVDAAPEISTFKHERPLWLQRVRQNSFRDDDTFEEGILKQPRRRSSLYYRQQQPVKYHTMLPLMGYVCTILLNHGLGQLNTNEDTVGASSVPEGVQRNRSEKSTV